MHEQSTNAYGDLTTTVRTINFYYGLVNETA